jgi:hypothetical protein
MKKNQQKKKMGHDHRSFLAKRSRLSHHLPYLVGHAAQW